MVKKYNFRIKTVDDTVLSIKVASYYVQDGFVCFFDEKYKVNKKFPVSAVEISEVDF